jgi:hypothetical protein
MILKDVADFRVEEGSKDDSIFEKRRTRNYKQK